MWHSSLSLLLMLVPAQEQNKGEQLFRQMETTLSKAKTLSFSFETSMDVAQGNKFSGSLASMSGNKARLELNGDFQGKPVKMLMVSDGTHMKMSGLGPDAQTQDTPKKFDEMVRAMVARAGVLLPLFMAEPVEQGQKPKEFNPDEQLRVSDFRLGAKEKLGERDAQVLEFRLTTKSGKESFSVTVWLDPKTNLPLKRIVAGKQEDQKVTITETYAKIALDEKLDEKKFELPK